MAKNLKLTIKNTQLAKAIDLNKIKKAVTSEKVEEEVVPTPREKAVVKKLEKEIAHEESTAPKKPRGRKPKTEVSAEHIEKAEEPPKAAEPKIELPPPPTEFKEVAKPKETVIPHIPKAEPEEFKKEIEKHQDEQQIEKPKTEYRPQHPTSGERPAYKPKSFEGEQIPPYKPRYEGGERPPYKPRYEGGERPPYKQRFEGGERPPYKPRYEGGERPPYKPRFEEGGAKPPYKPRYEGGERPPYKPRFEEGGARPPYKPRYEGGERPPYRPRGRFPEGEQKPGERFGAPRYPRPEGEGERPPYRPRLPRATMEFPPVGKGEGRIDISQKSQLKKEQRFHSARLEEVFDKEGGESPAIIKDRKKVKPVRKGFQEQSGFDARARKGLSEDESENWRKRRVKAKSKTREEEPLIELRPKFLKVRLPISVKDLAAAMKLKASELISKLFMNGIIVTLNDFLDDETAVQILGQECGCEIQIDTSREERLRITDKTIQEEILATTIESLQLRAPVVTFMGHVDHGKTSLIDRIRKSNMAAHEAGAITQHIGAFTCNTSVGRITILDTPGHEAFSAMRTRGATVTDIVVLVIAGDEGMKAQTLEALNQAKEAHVPIIVAINKCDRPGFDAENVYRQLSEQELLPEAWGGTTITVNCSAVTGQGVESLLELLSLQSEILELRANPNTRARGTVLESEMHKGLGPTANILVQNGTLHVSDAVVFDYYYAKIKNIYDEHGNPLESAGPSTPCKITGLSGLPISGSEFIVVATEKEAKSLAEDRSQNHKQTIIQHSKKLELEKLLSQEKAHIVKKTLNLIIKADVQGSLEALKSSLSKIKSQKVMLNIISEGIGAISESDAELAATSKAVILGFHTYVESRCEETIKEAGVKVRLHDIIYHAIDDITAIMKDLLDKLAVENDTGAAKVKATFKSSQFGTIAGCQIDDGSVKRNNFARVLRSGEVIWKGAIASLRKGKEDVKEVTKGSECGIILNGFSDFQEGDIIQAYEVTYLTQEL